MRLPRTPRPHSEAPRLSISPAHRIDGSNGGSTVVDVSGLSVASILAITILVIACLTTLLITGYCILSRRYAARIAAASRPPSHSRRTPAAKEGKPRGEDDQEATRGGARKEEGEESTKGMFCWLEPAHGYLPRCILRAGEGRSRLWGM